MRRFFLAVAIVAVFFALSAQDNSNDLYQQYLNQYNNNQQQPAPAQTEPAKPAEPAPAQAEPAKPAEEKKEEAQQPAEEKKE
jgi:hypothetical protein